MFSFKTFLIFSSVFVFLFFILPLITRLSVTLTKVSLVSLRFNYFGFCLVNTSYLSSSSSVSSMEDLVLVSLLFCVLISSFVKLILLLLSLFTVTLKKVTIISFATLLTCLLSLSELEDVSTLLYIFYIYLL